MEGFRRESLKAGRIISEGKTKRIREHPFNPTLVIVESKDDITAGDGAKHDLMTGKGRFSTETTSNVFRLLKSAELPIAFIKRIGENTFVASHCRMLPYEVVVRREAHGSYLKRHPDFPKGYTFSQTIVEFFLKTKERRWKNNTLPVDDPLMKVDIETGTIDLYEPGKPFPQKPFLKLAKSDVYSTHREHARFSHMAGISQEAFSILEGAWGLLGRCLIDFKVEFGIDANNKLLLADVIDNDSWRLTENGKHLDKQVYRNGGELSEVSARYARVAELSKLLSL